MAQTPKRNDRAGRSKEIPASESDKVSLAEGGRSSSRPLPSRGAKLPRVYGYSLENDGVLFRYELGPETNLVTDRETGERFRMNPADDMEVAVAGDFGEWAPKVMDRDPAHPLSFQLFVARRELPEEVHQFKFLINSRFWVEPPWFARNAVSTEAGADTKNLLLSFRHAGPDALLASTLGFAGSTADGDLERALNVAISLVNSAAHGIYTRSWETIDSGAVRALQSAIAADGHDPREVSGINVLVIVSGRISREIVVAHLPTGPLGQNWTDYVVEGDRLIGRLRTQLG